MFVYILKSPQNYFIISRTGLNRSIVSISQNDINHCSQNNMNVEVTSVSDLRRIVSRKLVTSDKLIAL